MALNLYIEQLGSGPELVLLHGWGLHGGIWEGIKHYLAQHFTLHIVDLPGYGYSDPIADNKADFTVYDIAIYLIEYLPKNAIWLGWSFGGSIATAAALIPDAKMRKLITVASNPKFTATPSWPCAMKTEVLANFGRQLERSYDSTIKRFLAIQSLGIRDQKKQVQTLQGWLLNKPEPDATTLKRDLLLLQSTDLRDSLVNVSIPHMLILGRSDALVPKGLAQTIIELKPEIRCELFQASSHAPFVSEPKRFLDTVKQFAQKDCV